MTEPVPASAVGKERISGDLAMEIGTLLCINYKFFLKKRFYEIMFKLHK